MAHYAFIDENNIVVNVIVGKNEGADSINWEQYYGAKRTSYNTYGGVYYHPETGLPAEDQSKAFRKNYAGIGYKYDEEKDAFIPPKPYISWSLNENTCLWEPPVPYPTDEKAYYWDEHGLSWVLIQGA